MTKLNIDQTISLRTNMSTKDEAKRFIFVGGGNFLLTFLVFTSMMKLLSASYTLSLVTAFIIGNVFTYLLNFFWVFKIDQRKLFKSRFPKYLAANSLSLIINLAALDYFAKRTTLDPFYIQFLLVPFVVVFNFSTAKFWSLRTHGV